MEAHKDNLVVLSHAQGIPNDNLCHVCKRNILKRLKAVPLDKAVTLMQQQAVKELFEHLEGYYDTLCRVYQHKNSTSSTMVRKRKQLALVENLVKEDLEQQDVESKKNDQEFYLSQQSLLELSGRTALFLEAEYM